jgi:D-alanyl-D-alanine carboxypeptidase
MLRAYRFAFMLCALSACSSANHDSELHDSTKPFPETAAADLQQTLDQVVAADVAPGVSVVVDRPGYAAWSGAAGVADIETRVALTPTEGFRAGSILKTAVATAVLQLVEHGKLSLDDKLTERLPEQFTAGIPSASAITLRMLLEHTSGIPEFDDAAFDAALVADPTHIWTLSELLERAALFPPLFPPGAGWSYSNTDYVLLGEIISQSAGKPWRQVVRERVFARAGLHQSSLPEEGNPRCDGCSRGYEAIDGTLVDYTEVDPSMAGAAGGDALITTTADLATFLGALAAGKLFDDPATLDLMLDFCDAVVEEQAQTGYGLGIARFQVGDAELIGHLGGAVGFQSFVFYQPSSRTVVSGVMNRTGDFGQFVLPVVAAVGRALATPAAAN